PLSSTVPLFDDRRQRERERRAAAFLRLAPDASRLLDDEAHEVEPRTGALGLDRDGVVGAIGLRRFRKLGAVGGQFEEPAYAGERRPELVADERDEVRLHPLGLFPLR